jgi:Undecaprenyl-phosphate glucose phosphotransferase
MGAMVTSETRYVNDAGSIGYGFHPAAPLERFLTLLVVNETSIYGRIRLLDQREVAVPDSTSVVQAEGIGAFLAPADHSLAGRPISRPVLIMLVQFVDLLLLMLAGFGSTMLYQFAFEHIPPGELTVAAAIGAATACFVLRARGGYRLRTLGHLSESLVQLVLPLIGSGVAVIVSLFLLRGDEMPSRAWPFMFVATGAVLLGGHRAMLRQLVRRWRRSGRLMQHIAIVGVNEFSATFIERLAAERDNYVVTGIYEDRTSRIPPHLRHYPVRGGVDALVAASRNERIDTIVVAMPLTAVDRINEILDRLSSLVVDVFLTVDVAGLRFEGAQFGAIGPNPVVGVGERPIKDWQAVKKAAFDRLIGGVALLCASPLLLTVAALIKLDSPGPVLFRQPRVGFDNRMFSIFKFRTMHTNMTDLLADRQTTRDDPRITRLGHYLRRYSVDELPQLLNVLQGDMSLVGPRPHAPNTKAADKLFADVVRQYAVRHRVKPGITGWAQVNGWRGETKTEDQLRNRVRFDLDYIQNWSLGLDAKILWLTVLREIRSKTAF